MRDEARAEKPSADGSRLTAHPQMPGIDQQHLQDRGGHAGVPNNVQHVNYPPATPGSLGTGTAHAAHVEAVNAQQHV